MLARAACRACCSSRLTASAAGSIAAHALQHHHRRGGARASSSPASGPPAPPLRVLAMAMPYSVQGPGAEKLQAQGCGGACSRDTPKVEPEELENYLKALPAWRLNAERTVLTRRFTAKNFVAAIKFFNKVADVAEAEGHHPDLHLTYFREVEVNVLTHAVSGITMADLVLAAKLDAIEVEYSPKWVKQQQEKEAEAEAAASAVL